MAIISTNLEHVGVVRRMLSGACREVQELICLVSTVGDPHGCSGIPEVILCLALNDPGFCGVERRLQWTALSRKLRIR